MKAIITSTGRDKIGILAEIAQYVSDARCNVEDITQTIMQGNFVMIMVVSLDSSPLSFGEIKEGFDRLAEKTGLAIRIQREELVDEMYHV